MGAVELILENSGVIALGLVGLVRLSLLSHRYPPRTIFCFVMLMCSSALLDHSLLRLECRL
jgi:hypothetical protein